MTARATREQLRVGRKLAELPAIREKFGTGRLSYSKVRALTRVAEPEMEEHLLTLAEEATAAQLERILRGYRRATTEDEVAARERRFFSTRWEEDGTLSVRGSLPAEEGALLRKALEIARGSLGGEVEFVDGQVIQAVAPSPVGSIEGCMRAGGRRPGDITAAPLSAGEPMDLDLTVWVLADLHDRRVPAGSAIQDAGSLRE
jgi:hypothetical protein